MKLMLCIRCLKAGFTDLQHSPVNKGARTVYTLAAQKLNTFPFFVKTKQLGESETSTLSTAVRVGPEERGRGGVFAACLTAES